MERVVKFIYDGKEYSAVFTSGIEFDFLEEYELENIFDIFKIKGSDRVRAVIELIRAMNAKAGGDILPAFEDAPPAVFMELQSALLKAITLGHLREVPPSEIDEGLAELEKKKEEQPERTSWFLRVLGWVFRSKKPTTRRRE